MAAPDETSADHVRSSDLDGNSLAFKDASAAMRSARAGARRCPAGTRSNGTPESSVYVGRAGGAVSQSEGSPIPCSFGRVDG